MNFDSGFLKWPVKVGNPVWHKGHKQVIVAANLLDSTVTIQDQDGSLDIVTVKSERKQK